MEHLISLFPLIAWIEKLLKDRLPFEEIKEAVWDCGSSKAPGPRMVNLLRCEEVLGPLFRKDLFDFRVIPFQIYLGLPIGSNMKSIASWKTLVDRFDQYLLPDSCHVTYLGIIYPTERSVCLCGRLSWTESLIDCISLRVVWILRTFWYFFRDAMLNLITNVLHLEGDIATDMVDCSFSRIGRNGNGIDGFWVLRSNSAGLEYSVEWWWYAAVTAAVVKVSVVVMLVTAVVWWRCRWLRGGSGSEVVLMMVTTVVGRMLWCRRGGVRRWGWCCSGMEMVETKVRVAVVVWRGGGEGRCMAWWWRRRRVGGWIE
ncbi:hypothetical protein Tco_0285802 [Tanacetum coccineum]